MCLRSVGSARISLIVLEGAIIAGIAEIWYATTAQIMMNMWVVMLTGGWEYVMPAIGTSKSWSDLKQENGASSLAISKLTISDENLYT